MRLLSFMKLETQIMRSTSLEGMSSGDVAAQQRYGE